MWNPYEPIPRNLRTGLGIGAAVSVLLIWSLLSGLEIIGPAKLPAPWAVASAFVHLAGMRIVARASC